MVPFLELSSDISGIDLFFTNLMYAKCSINPIKCIFMHAREKRLCTNLHNSKIRITTKKRKKIPPIVPILMFRSEKKHYEKHNNPN